MGISVYKKYMTEVFIKEKVERKPGLASTSSR